MSEYFPLPHPDILVECRIPTFKRPELLSRAIRSLRQQTCTNWRAAVLDDSPAREAEAVTASFNDERIAYVPNPMNLGAAANLDWAFSPQPLLGGSHAFVLEDDNALDPQFIEFGLRHLRIAGVHIVSFNQRRVDIFEDGGESPGGLLRENAREDFWDREQLLLNAFLGVSLPNGGYFWRLGISGLDLTVGSQVTESQLQECLRQIKVPPPILLCPEPVSFWSMLPATQVRRQIVGNRRLSANLNELGCAVVTALGTHRLVQLARQHLQGELAARFAQTLVDLSLLCTECRPWFHTNPVRAVKSALRFFLYRDRLHDAVSEIIEFHA